MPQQYVNSGERNRRIQIQKRSMAPDATTGEPSEAWLTVATVWARISSASSREVYQAGQFSQQVTHVVNVRWSSSLSVTNGMQVAYSGRAFIVQAVENVNECDRELNLMCMEINGVSS